MNFDIEVKGLNELISRLEGIEREQVPFAAALALTRVAQDVQQEIINQLPKKFTIRTKWYEPGMKYGIRTRKATKDKQEAEVYTTAPFMRLQEEGGTKTPIKEHLALPTEEVRRNAKDIITRANRPKALIGKGAAWVGKDRQGEPVIFWRTGKKKVRVPYVLKKQARIPKRWGFKETAKEVIYKRFWQRWREAFEEAMKTAK